MAAPIFKSQPSPTRALSKSVRKAGAHERIVIGPDDPVWEAAKKVVEIAGAKLAGGGALKGKIIHLIPPPLAKVKEVEVVSQFYESWGATVLMGAPSRFDRDDVI